MCECKQAKQQECLPRECLLQSNLQPLPVPAKLRELISKLLFLGVLSRNFTLGINRYECCHFEFIVCPAHEVYPCYNAVLLDMDELWKLAESSKPTDTSKKCLKDQEDLPKQKNKSKKVEEED
ncbi:unnamed protein product [Porites evermanni]|uniref:Uncharacterized protein n=1 Tax=Porites evermanni TaxID=104178 RepID=A0ABN8LMT7_9CNID|nr:unnamed protein product [Porites evermanni]